MDIELSPIHSFCFYERIHELLLPSSTVIKPDGSETLISSAEVLKDKYGIQINQGNMTSTLSIESSDTSLQDYRFALNIKSTLQEEQTWFNRTYIQINYAEPSC